MPLTLKHRIAYFILLTLPCTAFTTSSVKKPGSIVVTIKPLYSLVAQLSEGIEKPVLLMKQMPSPHHYSMRPSERRLLSNARMIVWIGPQMESYLSKVIQQQDTIVVSAMQADGLKLLDRRIKNNHQHTAASQKHDHPKPDNLKSNNIDPHIWLSSRNAIAISQHISQQLIISDSENTALYKNNLRRLINKITQLSTEIKTSLKNSQQPFITYHDAFQYFEYENKLRYIDSINFDEEAGTSLKHLHHIKTSIEKNNIQCLLYQPPKPDTIETLTNKTTIKAVALDPLGLTINNNKEAWFEIMRDMTSNFKRCLNS
jgi:zinc transport system substrate-binding protein